MKDENQPISFPDRISIEVSVNRTQPNYLRFCARCFQCNPIGSKPIPRSMGSRTWWIRSFSIITRDGLRTPLSSGNTPRKIHPKLGHQNEFFFAVSVYRTARWRGPIDGPPSRALTTHLFPPSTMAEEHAVATLAAKDTQQNGSSKTAPPKAGLEDVVAGQSSICLLDGKRGLLAYRGYDIHDLVKGSFEETAYLLLYSKLPNANELAEFNAKLVKSR